MWEFLAKRLLGQLAIQAGNKLAGVTGEANGSEAYADRIKRYFHLRDYADAWNLYDSDRDYWEKYYGPVPGIDARKESNVIPRIRLGFAAGTTSLSTTSPA